MPFSAWTKSSLGAQHQTHRKSRHRRGCASRRCDRAADRAFARRHRPKVTITRFDLCVANRENGEPGSTEYHFIDWHARNAYDGAFSWEQSKWEAGGGLRYAKHAYEAKPLQQVAVFHTNGRRGEWTPGNWPTIPPCLS